MKDHGPWLPAALRQFGPDVLAGFSYVVVDEITNNVATLVVAAWPRIDEHGRVRFPRLAQRYPVAVPLPALRQELYRGLVRREPRVGDVFAADEPPSTVRARIDEYARRRQLPEGIEPLWLEPLAALLPGRIYDISPHARTAAKLAYYGAMTAKLSPAQASSWQMMPAAVTPTTAAPSKELNPATPPAGPAPGERESGE